MREILKDDNCKLMNVEEFQMNGVRGVAFAAYQNEEITDYFKWNDKKSVKKKDGDQLNFLDEVNEDVPQPILINEYDVEIIHSDGEEDDDVTFLGGLKAENLLYNVKKEIKVDSESLLMRASGQSYQSLKSDGEG